MTAPEKIGLKQTTVLETSIPGVHIRLLEEQDLPEFKALMYKNAEYFMRSDIVAIGLYEMIEKEITTGEHADTRRRMGIWQDGVLIGYVGVVPGDSLSIPNEVDVSRAIDKDHVGSGIGTAVLEAVVKQETEMGNTVTAESLPRNRGSLRSLGKAGFRIAGRNSHDRTVLVYSASEHQASQK